LGEGHIVGVQTTSYSNMSARIKKIKEHPNFICVQRSGIKILVQGWVKRKNRWECREVVVDGDMEDDTGEAELPSI
jgi:hypothetical protein